MRAMCSSYLTNLEYLMKQKSKLMEATENYDNDTDDDVTGFC